MKKSTPAFKPRNFFPIKSKDSLIENLQVAPDRIVHEDFLRGPAARKASVFILRVWGNQATKIISWKKETEGEKKGGYLNSACNVH